MCQTYLTNEPRGESDEVARSAQRVLCCRCGGGPWRARRRLTRFSPLVINLRHRPRPPLKALRADVHPCTRQERSPARREIRQLLANLLARSPTVFTPRLGCATSCELSTSSFRLFRPTWYLRERIEEFMALVGKRVGS